MRRLCERTAAGIEGVVDRIGAAGAWLAGLLVLAVCVDVFFRYVLSRSSIAFQELEWHLCAALFLSCTAWTLREHRHVSVDVLSNRLPERWQAGVRLFGVLFLLLPFTVMLVVYSTPFAWTSWLMREGSDNPGGLPGRFVLKGMIPLAGCLLTLQGVAMGLRSGLALAAVPAKSDLQEDRCS